MTDRSGPLWVMTTDAGLRCLRVGNPSTVKSVLQLVGKYERTDGLSGNEGTGLLEDKEGDIWVATTEGLDRFTPTKLRVKSLPSGARGISIVGTGGSSVYVTTGVAKPGIISYGSASWEPLRNAPRSLTAAYRDQNGTLWFGAPGVIWRYRGNTFRRVAVPRSEGDADVESICRDREGRLWVVFDNERLFTLVGGLTWEEPSTSRAWLFQEPLKWIHKVSYGSATKEIASLDFTAITSFPFFHRQVFISVSLVRWRRGPAQCG